MRTPNIHERTLKDISRGTFKVTPETYNIALPLVFCLCKLSALLRYPESGQRFLQRGLLATPFFNRISLSTFMDENGWSKESIYRSIFSVPMPKEIDSLEFAQEFEKLLNEPILLLKNEIPYLLTSLRLPDFTPQIESFVKILFVGALIKSSPDGRNAIASVFRENSKLIFKGRDEQLAEFYFDSNSQIFMIAEALDLEKKPKSLFEAINSAATPKSEERLKIRPYSSKEQIFAAEMLVRDLEKLVNDYPISSNAEFSLEVALCRFVLTSSILNEVRNSLDGHGVRRKEIEDVVKASLDALHEAYSIRASENRSTESDADLLGVAQYRINHFWPELQNVPTPYFEQKRYNF